MHHFVMLLSLMGEVRSKLDGMVVFSVSNELQVLIETVVFVIMKQIASRTQR